MLFLAKGFVLEFDDINSNKNKAGVENIFWDHRAFCKQLKTNEDNMVVTVILTIHLNAETSQLQLLVDSHKYF